MSQTRRPQGVISALLLPRDAAGVPAWEAFEANAAYAIRAGLTGVCVNGATGEYAADIRMNPGIRWRPYELPAEVAERLLALVRRLGLEYGAVDFRVTPEGEHVFLEINPAGQFLYIENATGMKIADTLAGHLAAPGAARLAA